MLRKKEPRPNSDAWQTRKPRPVVEALTAFLVAFASTSVAAHSAIPPDNALSGRVAAVQVALRHAGPRTSASPAKGPGPVRLAQVPPWYNWGNWNNWNNWRNWMNWGNWGNWPNL